MSVSGVSASVAEACFVSQKGVAHLPIEPKQAVRSPIACYLADFSPACRVADETKEPKRLSDRQSVTGGTHVSG